MKVITLVGTRPELIRLCKIIKIFDSEFDHTLIHTGQNYDKNLSDVFFHELGIREPNYYLDARGTFAEQTAIMFPKVEQLLSTIAPDKILILGDTNSSLNAIIAKRMHIPVYHMEAGNRCFNNIVPEEVNRKIIDHCSDVLLPYTERSRQHLLDEGFARNKIYVTGNPIGEVLTEFMDDIDRSKILSSLKIAKNNYILATMHRAENVDDKYRLKNLVDSCMLLAKKYKMPVIVSTHPRTQKRLKEFSLTPSSKQIRFLAPFGFFDFVALQKSAFCVISDSGTAQEECAILKVPSVTLRDVTERPETFECGSNVLTGVTPELVLQGVRLATRTGESWSPPPEYIVPNVSDIVTRIIGSVRF